MATCERGQALDDRRDAAVLRVFIDTGARLSEVAGLRWDPSDDVMNDVDLEQGVIRVLGKGRRERVVAIGSKTIKALDRYLRARARHPSWSRGAGRRQPAAPATPSLLPVRYGSCRIGARSVVGGG